MSDLVSVIIPIYNCEKYISKCLNSIIKQTYKNIEIILINDGSTDNSKKICESYLDIDSRVRLYNQSNFGASYARNYGITVASGIYILFVDSDDYISEKFVEIALNFFNKNDIDYLKSAHVLVSNCSNNKVVSYNNWIFNKEDVSNEIGKNDNFSTIWGTFFKTKIIKSNNLSFDQSLTYGEDMLFSYNYLNLIKKGLYCSDIEYFYVYNENSLTNFISSENVKKYITNNIYIFNKMNNINKKNIHLKFYKKLNVMSKKIIKSKYSFSEFKNLVTIGKNEYNYNSFYRFNILSINENFINSLGIVLLKYKLFLLYYIIFKLLLSIKKMSYLNRR